MRGRTFKVRRLWWFEDDAFYLGFLDDDFQVPKGVGTTDHPEPQDYVLGKLFGLMTFKIVGKNVCEFTVIQNADACGNIPKILIDYKLKEQLNVINEVQQHFRRQASKVDEEVRELWCEKLRQQDVESRNLAIDAAKDAYNTLLAEGKEWTSIRSDEVTQFFQSKDSGSDGIYFGRALAVVDAEPEIVCAWWFDYCSNERMALHSVSKNSAKLIAKRTSFNDQVIASVRRLPWPFHKREFVARYIAWSDSAEGTYYLAIDSKGVAADYNVDYGSRLKLVRGEITAIVKFSQHSAGRTNVELSQYLSPNASYIPNFIKNAKLPESLKPILDAQKRFNRDDEIDGAVRAETSMLLFEGKVALSSEEISVINGTGDYFLKLKKEKSEWGDLFDGTDPTLKMR